MIILPYVLSQTATDGYRPATHAKSSSSLLIVLVDVDLGAVAAANLRFLLGKVSATSSANPEDKLLSGLTLPPGVLDTTLFDTHANGCRATGGMD